MIVNQALKSRSLNLQTCSLCGKPVASQIRSFQDRLAAPVIRRLEREHPGWSPGQIVCPDCIFRAAEALRQVRSRTSLHEELMLPFPVYALDEIHLLATPQRIGANPHYTGRGVSMAFIDSGFYPHADLTRRRNRILCYVDATGLEPVEKRRIDKPDARSWHGMMTSCVAAGDGYQSGSLYRGLASQANLVLVKAGNQFNRGINEADIQRALEWVLKNQARFAIRIVNISLGGDNPSNGRLGDLNQVVEEAVRRGMVVVVAAGNTGSEWLVPPADAPSAITVGGLDDGNSLDSRQWRMYPSSYGRSVDERSKPEIIAPASWLAAPMLPRSRVHVEGMLLWRMSGVVDLMNGLLEAVPGQGQRLDSTQRRIRERMIEQKYIHPHYQHVDGTSMSAPLVSSVVAQMLEANPGLTPPQVKAILMGTAILLKEAPRDRQGCGIVHAGRAVAAALRIGSDALLSLPLSPDIQAETVSFYFLDPHHRARSVALVGSFNLWNPGRHAMRKILPGVWEVSIPLPHAGQHRYKFLVDHTWCEDPENPRRVEDGFGGFCSLLEVKS